MAHVFTVKSNAGRKVRATVEQYPQSCTAEDLAVEPAEGGFVIRMTVRDEAGQAFARYHGFEYAGIEPEASPEPALEADTPKARESCAPVAPAAKAQHAGPGKFAAIREAAERGELPPVPDFSADLHKRNRGRLAQLVAMAEAGDVAGLEAFPIKPNCTSPKAMDRYRNLCVVALKAHAGAGVRQSA
jgi:hypothetical protein